MQRRVSWRLSLLCLLAAVLRLGLIAWHWGGTPAWFQSGDYILYRIGGEHILTYHNLSNSLFLVRTPLFPALIAALGVNDLAVLIANALIGVGVVPLTYILARQLGGRDPLALGAAFVAAVDPTAVNYSAFLGPEALANTLTVAAVVAAFYAVQRPPSWRAYGWGAVAGVLLVLSAYARPSAYVLWVPLALWLLVAYRRRWRVVLVFVLVSVLGVGAWIVHNQRVFHYATFSTIGPYTMAYYRAAAVEHISSGDDMDAVYTRINQRVVELADLDLPVNADTRHHFLASTPAVAHALTQTSWEIFKAHPWVYLATFPLGFARLYGLMTHSLARTFGALALAEMAWNWVFTLFAFGGMWVMWRRKLWLLLSLTLLLVVYYTAGTLLVKSAGMTTRERSVLTPWLAIAFVYGVDALNRRYALGARAKAWAARIFPRPRAY